MTHLVNLANLAAGMILIFVGLTQSDSGYLWSACLIAGGVYIGHVITEALNNPTDQSE